MARTTAGDDAADYIAFEDETGRVERMAVVRPAAPLPDPVAASALALGLLRRDESEPTVTRVPDGPVELGDADAFEDKTTKKKPDPPARPDADGFDDQSAPTIARRLFGATAPATTADTPPARDVATVAAVAVPLPRAPAAPPESRPESRPVAKEETKVLEVSHASSASRDALPPPARPPAIEEIAALRRDEPSGPRLGGVPVAQWLPPPPLDHTPPPRPATMTPMVMSLSNSHVSASYARPPIPYPQPVAPAEALPPVWPRLLLLAAGTLVIAAAVFFVLRPRLDGSASASAAAPPGEPTPVLIDPLSLAPVPSPAAPPATEPPAATDIPPAEPLPAGTNTAAREASKKKAKPAPHHGAATTGGGGAIPARRED